ncbi:hypothetical protein NL676_033437 [Syzygium grande]|nr:hypothetical protein NL676_033437 [Syzygium grande]
MKNGGKGGGGSGGPRANPRPDARKDRKSATGVSGSPKKGGHGGKFTWSGDGYSRAEMGIGREAAVDAKDPNFEDPEDEGQAQAQGQGSGLRLRPRPPLDSRSRPLDRRRRRAVGVRVGSDCKYFAGVC